MPTREELEIELAALNHLYELSTRLTREMELQPLLEEVLDATVALQNADYGFMQLYDTHSRTLKMVAQRRLPQPLVEQLKYAEGASCGRALKLRERVIIEDVLLDEEFAPYCPLALSADFRAVQCTPLFGGGGAALGTITTYFRNPHRPLPCELRLTDLYIRQATQLIERKRTEAALRASEERFRRYFELGLIGMAVTSPGQRCVEVNDELCRLLGYERRELLEKNWMELTHPDDRAADELQFDRVMAGEIDNFALEKRWICKDGRVIDTLAAARCLRRPDGAVDSFLGLVLDITGRIRAEKRLRESEHRFRLLLESIAHHVWSFRPDGTVGYWNQRLLDYTGLTPWELRQGGWEAFHPDELGDVWAAWEEAWAHGTQYEREQRILGHDGRYRRFLVRGVPVKDEHGATVEWLGTNTDIEARRQAEEALHTAQSQLAHVTRVTMMGELAGSIAHEINQPLAAIIANGNACARWLAAPQPNFAEANAAIGRVIRDAKRASEVVAQVHAFLRREESRARLDINDLVREVMDLIQSEIRTHGVSVQLALASNLPPVIADRIQLQQVMLNLLINALEAMAAVAEGRLLSIRTERRDAGSVTVSVRDAGMGLNPANIEKVFDAFYTTKPRGLGMGLAISRSIVEAHGGRLWATHNADRGETFHFTVPVAPAPDSAAG